MDITIDPLSGYLSNPGVIVLTLVVLLGYRFLSSRFPRVPRIPLGLVFAYLVLHLVLALLAPQANPKLTQVVAIAATIMFYWAAIRVAFALTIDFWLMIRRFETFPRITRDFILYALYVIVAFVVLRTRGGVNLIGLMTTSAVLTVVIGLAAQNTLSNLFAGLSLQFERPYRIGDWIQYGESTGQVVGIGWQSTRLRTFDEELVFVPNMDIAKSVLKNFSNPYRQLMMRIQVGLDYDAPPNKVKQVILDALKHESRVLQDPPPEVNILNFGDSAVTYRVSFQFEDFGQSPQLRGEVMKGLWYALRRHRIRIPYPIRDMRPYNVTERRSQEEQEAERRTARLHLDSVPILATLSLEERDLIASVMRPEVYGDGEAIVRQGEAGDSMFLLRRGACEVLVHKGDAPAVVAATLTPPSFFGEMSLLTGEPRSATVRAQGDAHLFVIDRALFAEILIKNSAIAERLAATLVARQAGLAQALDKQDKDLAAQTTSMLKLIRSFFGLD